MAYGNDYFSFARSANNTTRKYAAIWNGDSWSRFEGLSAFSPMMEVLLGLSTHWDDYSQEVVVIAQKYRRTSRPHPLHAYYANYS